MSRKIKLKAKMTTKRSILSESDVIQKIRQELHEDDPGRALFHLIQSDQPEARKAIMFDYINKNSEGQIIKGFVKELEMFKFSNVGRAHMKIANTGSDKDDLSVEFVSISEFDDKPSEDILEAIKKTVEEFLKKNLYPFEVSFYDASWNSSNYYYKASFDFYYDITQKSHREAYKAFESVYKCCENFDDVCGTIEEIILNETFPERTTFRLSNV